MIDFSDYDDIKKGMRERGVDDALNLKIYHQLIYSGEWIPMEEMIVGALYLCNARNFYLGIWNGERFDYMRYKFGQTFPDTELHWDEGPPFGTVKPLLLLKEDAS